jgi:hypothetical protein
LCNGKGWCNGKAAARAHRNPHQLAVLFGIHPSHPNSQRPSTIQNSPGRQQGGGGGAGTTRGAGQGPGGGVGGAGVRVGVGATRAFDEALFIT